MTAPSTDREQQRTVDASVGVSTQDAIVTVQFDSEAKPPHDEPERRVPREEQHCEHRHEEALRIPRAQMLALVMEHEPPCSSIEGERPAGNHDALAQVANRDPRP